MIEIDSVPIFTAPRTGPVSGALYFRVGRADENFGNHGITHLVEHLAFYGLVDENVHSNGMTTDTYTCFFATGERDQVVGFLSQICANLTNLPLDQVDKEKEILRTEQTWRGGALREAQSTLHGVQDFGLTGIKQIGLNRVTAEEVARWAATYFTAQNAAGFITCDDGLDTLRLPLPPGVRQPVPIPSLNPAVDPLPSHYSSASNEVVFEAIIGRGASVAVMEYLAGERFLHEAREVDALSYSLSVTTSVVTADSSRFSCVADTVPENGAGVAGCLTDALAALCYGQFTDEELARAKAAAMKEYEDEDVESKMLPTHVINHLLGREDKTVEELRRGCAEVTREDIIELARTIRANAMWVTPAGNLEWAGVSSSHFTLEPMEGHEFAQIGGTGKLIVSDKGVTLDSGKGSTWTVRFDQCVGIETYPDGLRVVVSLTVVTVSIEPTLYQGLTPALTAALVDARVPGDRLIPMPARRPGDIPVPPTPEVPAPQYAPAPVPTAPMPPGFTVPMQSGAPTPGVAMQPGMPMPGVGTAPPYPQGYAQGVQPAYAPMGQPKKKTGMTVLFIILAIVFGLATLICLLLLLLMLGDSDPGAATARLVFGVLLALMGIPTAIFIWQAIRSSRN